MKYRYFTKFEANEWQATHPTSPSSPASNLHLEYFDHCDDKDIVAAVAIDDDTIVGHKLVSPCFLLVNGEILKCMVGEGTYVDPKLRGKGIGKRLLQNIIDLRVPQISTNVSMAMKSILDKDDDYICVDSSPIFVLPIDLNSAIRYSRVELYRDKNGEQSRPKILLRNFRNIFKSQVRRTNRIEALPSNKAINCLEQTLLSIKYPVQVPWDIKQINGALKGEEDNLKAWVIDIANGEEHSRHLITLYIKGGRTLSQMRQNREIEFREAHLNEIFPPLNNTEVIYDVISFCQKQAGRFSLSALKIYAMNDCLVKACEKMRLFNTENKRIYIAPVGTKGAILDTLSNPDSWWCRAINESHFNETKSAAISSGEFQAQQSD